MSELINNRAHRIQTMKEIIKHLHRGGSPDEVRGDSGPWSGRPMHQRSRPWSRN